MMKTNVREISKTRNTTIKVNLPKPKIQIERSSQFIQKDKNHINKDNPLKEIW